MNMILGHSRPALAFITLGVLGFALSGCSGSKTTTSAETTGPQPKVTHTAVIETSLGDIEVELYGEDAPKTVKNFVTLANDAFYNGILFHRVVPGFVVQAGDPKTRDAALKGEWGTGGRSIYGDTFEDELTPGKPSYDRGYKEGVLAMANAGANTNSSQFFIMLRDNTTLPKAYTIFGKVTAGMDVVHAMENISRDASDVPTKPITILEIDTDEL